MFRSLHMKLVLIMTLLIVSLMTVVGAFLINSVVGYYIKDFYLQMERAFEEDPNLLHDLTTAGAGEEDGAAQIAAVLEGYNSALGVDNRSRWFYVLDGTDGHCLAASGDESGENLETTYNMGQAIAGAVGDDSDPSANYMDVAIPITRGGREYVVYIKDNRQTVQNLNSEFLTLIIGALVFGIIISVLLSFLLSKTMITPIQRLTDGAERVAAGDFSHKIEVASRDEIGILTGTFNNMARQLQETILEVENERNKLGTLFLHMTDGVVAFSHDGAVIHSNPAAEKMLGRPITIDGDVGYDALFGDIAPIDDVLAVAPPGYLEESRDRAGRSLEILLAPFDRDRQRVLVVIHDVTEQRRTEEMRREFVANVSHELRTPLTNIRSYAETLVDNAGSIPPEMEQNFLSVILNESDRMTHIVQDLLTLSRFDSGHNELARFSFSQAVDDVHRAVLMEAQRHCHTVTLDLPSAPEVVGDRERVVQVMMNIVSNAIKYTPDGGKIDISAGQTGEMVWMQVSDNGIGIPAEDRARIFERFYRVDKARSRESGGTGLGLSIAKEIIDRHDGRIYIVDRPGPGLTVRLELLVEVPVMAGRKKGLRRWVELGKDVLLIFLTCSAVFLAAQTNAYHSLAEDLSQRVSSLFHREEPSGGPAAAPGRPLIASRPVAAAIRPEGESESDPGHPENQSGPGHPGIQSDPGRYGVQYDSAEVARLFEQHSGLLGEVLAVAQPPHSISQKTWRTALQSPGLYYQFPAPVPLSALYAWLGEGEQNSALTISALRLVLCRGESGRVELCYQASEDGPYFRSFTNLSYEEYLAEPLAGYGSNGALFAFELTDPLYEALSPYTLLCDSPAPPLYQGSTPLSLTDESDLDALQRQLSFHPQFSTVYQVPEIVSVREDEDSLRIGTNGLVTFHAEVRETPRYPVGETDTPTESQLIDGAYRLALATLGQRCGEATLAFASLTQQGGSYEITFDYYLDGAAVSLPGGGSAARFIITQGQITDFWLRFRRYEPTGETGLLLPEEQAVAALSTLSDQGGALVRRYRDSGSGPVDAAWALVE